MSYLVFARKYRPQTFEAVVAQDHITRTLRNALKNDRVGSGYLFCGPRGTGKTTIARLLAKAVNCQDGPTEHPCGECPACKEISAGVSLDVLEIDAASNTGVDDIRTLKENVRYLPTNGKKRVFIIDEVHRLSGSAFDALLKTLEEPPSHVIFILATTEPLKVPDTILSRTQRFDFRRVAVEDLTRHLEDIATREKLAFDASALILLARKADGSVRDALSLLDQIAAFAGDTIGEQDVVAALGLVDRQFLFDFVEAIAAADRRQVLGHIKTLFESGIEVADFVDDLLEHWRCLMLVASDAKSGDLLDLSGAELDQYQRQAECFTIGDILRHLKIAAELRLDLRTGIDQRLLLETASVRMAELESTVRFEEILAHLKQDRPNHGQGEATTRPSESKSDLFASPGSPADTPPPPPPPPATRPTTPGAVDKKMNIPRLKAGWEDFLSSLRKTSPMLASQVHMAEIRTVHDNELLMVFPASCEPSRQLVLKEENLKLINRLLFEHYQADLRARFEIDPQIKEPGSSGGKAEPPPIDAKELVNNSPRLKSLLDRVDGEIVGVKKIDE